MKSFIGLFLLLILNSLFLNAYAESIQQVREQGFKSYPTGTAYYLTSFSKSKRLLLQLYSDHQITFYCDCLFDNKKKIDAGTCGYMARKNARRGQRVEWEHIIPAHRFGSFRSCWKEQSSYPRCIKKNGKTLSGRKCCRRVDPEFKEMEADLLNLVPAVGELNGDRSNYSFGDIEGELRRYGQCDFEVNFKEKIVEPPINLRGNIARVYYYFQETYGLLLTEEEIQRFGQWHSDDPMDEWEKEKERRVNQVLISAGKKRENIPVFVEID